jgi:hypothetical protein
MNRTNNFESNKPKSNTNSNSNSGSDSNSGSKSNPNSNPNTNSNLEHKTRESPMLSMAGKHNNKTVEQQQQKNLIRIKISKENLLRYKKLKFEGHNSLYLRDDFDCHVPEGADIKIGQNIFCIVNDFKQNTMDIPIHNKTLPITITLPAGTRIISNNGLPIAICDPIDVALPGVCFVKLLPQTKLQQRDAPVQLILVTETTVELITKCESSQMNNKSMQMNDKSSQMNNKSSQKNIKSSQIDCEFDIISSHIRTEFRMPLPSETTKSCKFGSTCNIPKCGYVHPELSNQKQPCKYGPACNIPKCGYVHPEPCKYGPDCNIPKCGYVHPEPCRYDNSNIDTNHTTINVELISPLNSLVVDVDADTEIHNDDYTVVYS